MAKHPLFTEIANLRKSSGYDIREFAYQAGLSIGGYEKFERGTRLPKLTTLQRILNTAKPPPSVATKILDLWNDVKAAQAGITVHLGQTPKVDSAALSRRISSEAVFVLKQAGLTMPLSTKPILEKRVLMILKSALGA